MQRVTVTLDEELVAEVDALMRERGYPVGRVTIGE